MNHAPLNPNIDARWQWPSDVTSLRELMVADAVAATMRHQIVNLVTSMGNACYLLKRQGAVASAGEDTATLLEHIVRNVGEITRSLDVRYLGPPMQDVSCLAGHELTQLAADLAPAPIAVTVPQELAALRTAMPREEFRTVIACALDALEARSGASERISLALTASKFDHLSLIVGATSKNATLGVDTADQGQHQLWFDVARHILRRRGGSLHRETTEIILVLPQ